jgi:hypothetical protein
MAHLKRTYNLWLARALAALLLAAVTLVGGAGSALAHYDDDEIVTYGPNACTVVAELPAYPSAVCVKNEREVDDGVTQNTNTYIAQGATGEAVRLHFEAAFQQNGWTVVKAKRDVEDQEWEYTVVKGLRRVKVEVEALEPHQGNGTGITIEEK